MEYSTKQRKILLDFFNSNLDRSISADEICLALASRGISESAVYRNLNTLEAEGKIRRTAKPNCRKAFYQFVDSDECKDHIHMSCTVCGETMHLDEKEAMKLINEVFKSSKFSINTGSTILYGVCEKCEGGSL